jgi:hypothetical protein
MNNNYELQASPAVLELTGGWDFIQELVESIAPHWQEEWFIPVAAISFKHPDHHKYKNHHVKVLMWEYKGLLIEIIGYIDKNGIKVFSLDPARKLQKLGEGHQRV